MKKQKKILAQLLIFLTIILTSSKVFATDLANYLGKIQFSENYSKYLDLSDEEKENVIVPRMYDIPKTTKQTTNPLKMSKILRSTLSSKYSLKDIISENMVIKNQMQTNSCWTFSSLATLESTLALKDYKSGKSAVVYDFSERHMEYATSKTFLDNVINKHGFNRKVGDGGFPSLAIAYLTNGTGAVPETEMQFENNENQIDISKIQNKTVSTQVNDTVDFPSYSVTEDKTWIKQKMKEHIINHGAIDSSIYGASISDTSCYNNETGAIYCNNEYKYKINHAVAIVGWDDNYSTENFVENNRPQNNGAWIIKNSWGSEARYTLSEMKALIFKLFPNECIELGWTEEAQIPDEFATEFFIENGYTVENNEAILKIGDKGFMYVSYEDVNIYKQLAGIVDAQTEITYENIYQYDYYGAAMAVSLSIPKIYLATVFDKETTGKEYLTQVAINAPETYICKVYVNPNGTSKKMSDLQLVQLKSGETETFDAGYHTIEFLEPIKIEGESFVVVLEIQGTQTYTTSLLMEFNYGEFFGEDASAGQIYNNVTVESGKCFFANEAGVNANIWYDAGNAYTDFNGKLPNFDTTIKAFTTSKVLENIQITTPPTKTSYVEGQNFDATGMVVTGYYADGNSKEIEDYTVQNGNKLQLGQTEVTIKYEGKTTTQKIEVVKNSVENITIKTPPTKLEYWAGEDFEETGMVIEAIYKDGATKKVTDYTVEDGKTLKNGQTTVTIKYEGKKVTQPITVKPNTVTGIEITKAPNKVKYVVGQNFDTTGMIVIATYKSGIQKEVIDYTIKDGTNLQIEQTTVTVEYEGKSAIQSITVEAKEVISIAVKTMPTKTEYIQNKEELDLTGGVIEISYNDESKEKMPMTSKEITVSGFSNKKLGTNTITVAYKEKTTQFNVEIKELAKPKNSNFDNMQGSVKRVRAYYFADINKKEYTVLNVELSNIMKSEQNEKMEYYYYLSSRQKEANITNWKKINDAQIENGKLSLEINTSDISNYEEVSNAENLYLYIKEVATKNEMEQEIITSSVLLEVKNVNIEEYLDGEKIAEVTPGKDEYSTSADKKDETLAPGTLPNTGRNILIVLIILAIFVVGRIMYSRYKNIKLE